MTPDLDNDILRLVQQVFTCSPDEKGRHALEYFERHPESDGFVVIEGGIVVGIVMRNDFFQLLGRRFGHDLYLNRPVRIVMNNHPLVVDAGTSMARLGTLAMGRERGLYDFVVVTGTDGYKGVISIKMLLLELSRHKEAEIDMLRRQGEILRKSNEAEQRHRKMMEERNRAVRNLLDNAKQGFLSVDKRLRVLEEYSRECLGIFGEPIGGKGIADLLGAQFPADERDLIALVFRQVFEEPDAARQDVVLTLLPQEMEIAGKHVTISYRMIDGPTGRSVMLILTDASDRRALEERMSEERNTMRMVIRALTNKSDINQAVGDFRDFFERDAVRLLEEAPSAQEGLVAIRRAIHTFKGDFGQLHMAHTAKRIHELEDGLAMLSKVVQPPGRDEVRAFLGRIDHAAMLAEDIRILSEILGDRFFDNNEFFSVSGAAILDIERRISDLSVPDREKQGMLARIEKLRQHNFKDLIRQYEGYVQGLAERLDKKIGRIQLEGDDIFIDKACYTKIAKSIVHIFRNIVDHGIEPLDERMDAGKPEDGRIACNFTMLDLDRFRICIRDDGRGVDFDAVRAKALTRGLIDPGQAVSLSDDGLLQLLFLDGFSVKEHVGVVSGRGVGLSAVRAEVEALGGHISIASRRNEGTEFRITLPFLRAQQTTTN